MIERPPPRDRAWWPTILLASSIREACERLDAECNPPPKDKS